MPSSSARSPPRATGLSSRGVSASWTAQKKNIERIINGFTASTPERKKKYPSPWQALKEETLCSQEFYGEFAQYLLHEYKIEGGQYDGSFLSCATVTNYLSTSINMASDQFKATGSDQTKLFFTCLDTSANTAAAVWLRGLKANITRTT